MELGGILLIIFLGVLTFLGECPTGSVAARLCPVRAEPVYPAEVNGVVRCSCKSPFFGKNCRFKEQNGTVDVNGTRVSKKLVMISWREKEDEVEERRYLVSVRRIQHKPLLLGFGKWRKAAIYTDSIAKNTASPFPSTTHTAVLRLPAISSFEVKITTVNGAGDQLGSSSVYFDASGALASGQMLATSQKIQDFKRHLLESFQDEHTLKGLVVGVIAGSIFALMIMAYVYGLIRYCRKCRKQRCPSPDVESKQETKETSSEDVAEISLNIENLSRASSYIIIDMKDIDIAPGQTVSAVSSKSAEPEQAYNPDNNSSSGNPSQQTTGASETVERAKECGEPAEPEIVVDNNATRTIWDACEYM